MTRYALGGLRLLAAVALATGLAGFAARAEVRTPIDACGTIDQPGSYVLTQNLTASGDCIEVTADRVTIDLNGFAITGDQTGAGIAVITAGSGLTVRNGTIANFRSGITSAKNCTLHDLRILDNTAVGTTTGISSSDSCIVSGNIVSETDNGFSSVFQTLSSDNIARGNRLAGNNGATDSVVSGNVFENNGQTGVFALSGSLLTGNTVHNHSFEGILQSFRSPNHLGLTNNAVTANDRGINLLSDDNGVLALYNSVRANPGGNLNGDCTNCTLIHNAGIPDSP